MSRKGNGLHNAVAENFFTHLKQEFIRRRHFASVAQFRVELEAYIRWFNHDRIREGLDGFSLVAYRRHTAGMAGVRRLAQRDWAQRAQVLVG